MIFKRILRSALIQLLFFNLFLVTFFSVTFFSVTFHELGSQNLAEAQTLELYVDQTTKQVFTEPGPGRVKLGAFAPALPPGKGQSISTTPNASVPVVKPPSEDKHWYDKLSLRGYTQMRYSGMMSRDGADWFHPADRSVAKDQTFLIRRGRLILSGDVTDHLFLYAQPDLFASPSDGDFSLQSRDLYGDLSFDKKKEFRVRFGQSKVPFGFVNMQSSQNRLTLERAEALNSAVESERDIGAFFYWAPEEIRSRFKMLVKDGLKGSGDYGVFALGAYSGQGLNRQDANDTPHIVSRVSYPFKVGEDQIFEAGVQGYHGRFVPRTSSFTLEGDEDATTPKFRSDGIIDQRAGVSAILYPQPFGIEAEWNFGRGPQLSEDMRTIEEKSLNGGYVLANVKLDAGAEAGIFFPFVRWQYFDGGRKFARNAPEVLLNEWDVGVEWQPLPEFELTAQYSFSNERTNTNVFPYNQLTDGSRFAVQAQLNY